MISILGPRLLAAIPVLAPTLLAQTQTQSQLPPDVARTHFPDLHDPELHAGTPQHFTRGEVTPDGRLILAYRRILDDFDAGDGVPDYTLETPRRVALTVASIDPSAFTPNAAGHLDTLSKVDEVSGDQEYMFGDDSGSYRWEFIHWANALTAFDRDEDPPEKQILMTGSPFWADPPEYGLKFDENYPIPFSKGGSSMITVAMRSTHGNYQFDDAQLPPPPPSQTPGAPLPANPHPSDPSGAFLENGDHTTYHLWIVRLHARGFLELGLANTFGPSTSTKDPLVVPTQPDEHKRVLACQDLRVVVAPDGSIESADVGTYRVITSPDLLSEGASPDGSIRALEPTITSDGKLIVYNGGGTQITEGGNGRVTYIGNAIGCEPDGWTRPASITKVPDYEDMGFTSSAELLENFKVFAAPVRMPPSATEPAGYLFSENESVHGPYPWISRDGSFFIAGGTHSNEADPTIPGYTGKRAGTYACGEITGGYIKYLDGNGLNPTRYGAQWSWPVLTASNDNTIRSERSVFISPGMSPGPWQFLPGDDVPIPSQVATRAIPVMPVVFTNSHAYGEIRFEEGDGHYLLYLPCNESLVRDPQATDKDPFIFGVEDPTEPTSTDATSTPDTSGRSVRGYGELNAGAAFPREAYTNGGQSPGDLRAAVGAAYTADLDFYDGVTFATLHSNLGFRGQGILMNGSGQVEVGQQDWDLRLRTELTAQLFVKFTAAPTADLTLLEHRVTYQGTEYDLVRLAVGSDGVPYGSVRVRPAGTSDAPQLVSVVADSALSDSSALADNKAGWHHLALVFEGTSSPSGLPSLTIWVDGVPESEPILRSEFPDLQQAQVSEWRTLVGPGRGSPSIVTTANALMVVDEVALSDVARTEWEIRRDACVELPDDGFVPAPAGQGLEGFLTGTPFGLDDVRWPTDATGAAVPFSMGVRDLGEQLFADLDLSVSGVQACTTCHIPGQALATPGQAVAQGNSGPLPFNTPSLFNAGLGGHKRFSGGAASIEEQVVAVLESPEEMGEQSIADLVSWMNASGSPYVTAFNAAYMDSAGVTEERLTQSLAMYLRTEYTASTVVDQGTLTPAQARGKALFFGKARCFSCHSGPNFTDEDFHNVNTVLADSVEADFPDRFSVTSRTTDEGALKTPTLRGLAGTAPYFHDGTGTSDLMVVVDHYDRPSLKGQAKGTPDRHLRPLGLSLQEKEDLVAFLLSLSD